MTIATVGVSARSGQKRGNNKEMVHPCPSSNTLNIASIANFSSKSWEIQLEILIWVENRQLYVYHAPGRKKHRRVSEAVTLKDGFPVFIRASRTGLCLL